MYRLRLTAKRCLSCGVCEDVCGPRAIGMRGWRGKRPEGEILSHALLGSRFNQEPAAALMASFPSLVSPAACDGCRDCVVQCPVAALELLRNDEPARPAGRDLAPRHFGSQPTIRTRRS